MTKTAKLIPSVVILNDDAHNDRALLPFIILVRQPQKVLQRHLQVMITRHERLAYAFHSQEMSLYMSINKVRIYNL